MSNPTHRLAAWFALANAGSLIVTAVAGPVPAWQAVLSGLVIIAMASIVLWGHLVPAGRDAPSR